MHHYNVDNIKVEVTPQIFKILIYNSVTGAEITVTGPVVGVYEDPLKVMTDLKAKYLAQQLISLFRNYLM